MSVEHLEGILDELSTHGTAMLNCRRPLLVKLGTAPEVVWVCRVTIKNEMFGAELEVTSEQQPYPLAAARECITRLKSMMMATSREVLS